MANNAIALQVRAPQSNPLGNIVQQNAQLINMMQQQRAAEAAAARDQQQLQAAKVKEERDRATAEIDLAGKQIDFHYKRATAVSSPQGYAAWLAGVERDSPEFADFFRTNMPPEQFNRDQLIRMVGGIKENFDATYGPVNTEVVIGKGGRPAVITRGGFNAPNISYPETFEPDPEAAPPPRAGKVDLGPQITVDSDQGGIYEVPPAGSPQAETSVGVPQMAPDATPMRIVVDGAKMLGAIIDEPNPTKREADYQLFLTSLDKTAPQLAQLIRENAPTFNLQYANEVLSAAKDYIANPQGDGSTRPAPSAAQTVVSQGDIPLVEGPRGGPYEGYRRAAPFVAKDPTVGAYPGSALVPPEVLGRQAAAQRESPGEVYAKEAARLRAQQEAATNAPPKRLTPQQEQRLRANMAKDNASAQAIVDNMVDPKIGVISAIQRLRKLTPDQKEWLVGYTTYIPSITDAGKRADSLWKDLEGKVTQMGKSAASSSGAIGNMAVQEWQIVRDMIASLDLTKMDVKTFDEKLELIENTARIAADRARRIYEDQYAEEFARYPGRFQLKVPAAPAAGRAPAKRRTKTGVDYNNPLLR